LSGNYGSQSPVDLHRHSFFLGPQFNVYSKGRARLFLVALFGAIHDSSRFRFRTGNVRAAASSSVLEYGGGFDVRLTRYVSYRIEVFPNFFPEEWQNDGRVTTGLVFHFGARKHH